MGSPSRQAALAGGRSSPAAHGGAQRRASPGTSPGAAPGASVCTRCKPTGRGLRRGEASMSDHGSFCCPEAGVEVGQDVLDVLDPDREADQTGGHPGERLLLRRELAVRCRGGVDDQRAHVPDVRNVRVQLEGVDERLAGLCATLDLEGEHRTGPLRCVLLGVGVPPAGRQPRVVHADDVVARLEPLGHPLGVCDVALDAQGQGLDPQGDQEGVERRDRRTEVTQQLDPCLEDERQVHPEQAADAQVTGEDQAVVAGVRSVVVGEALRVLGVVEGSAVDDHPADGRAVTAQVLGRRVHDDVSTPLDRADQVRRRHRVVDDQRDADLVRDPSDRLDVEDVGLRVGDGLAEEQLGVGLDGVPPGLWVVRVGDERRRDPELGQGVVQQVVGAAVQAGAGHDVVAGLGDVQEREGLRGLAGGDQQGADAALEGGDAVLHHLLGGVADPGIDGTEVGNPTQQVVEDRIASLEGGVGALLVASGQAAATLAFLNIAEAGDHIVASPSLYGGTYNLLHYTLPKLGITTTFVTDPHDPQAWRDAVQPNTKLFFGETIPNPKSDILDIETVAGIAHEVGVPLIVDNTVATPYLIRPIEWGADIVVHSATKYLGGHGTAIGGVIVDGGTFDYAQHPERFPNFNTPDPSYNGLVFARDLGVGSAFGANLSYILKARVQLLRVLGSAISPFNAFLIAQGVETLSLRVDHQ